ncbi:hypothetical protein MUB15_07390 [Priestia sp. OVS21]|nr:hypothetical protein [Priestia sp. OVS21]
MPKLLWRIGAVMLLMCGGFIFLFIAASQMMVQQYKPFLDGRVHNSRVFLLSIILFMVIYISKRYRRGK